MRLYSRPGNDLTDRFSLIVEALAGLRSRSWIIDGEAVACDERGCPEPSGPPNFFWTPARRIWINKGAMEHRPVVVYSVPN